MAWGDLDILIIDLPPGTQRLVELHELAPSLAGVVAVTIPSGASRDAVARSLELCARRGISVFGIVENMAGYRCQDCGATGPLHDGEAGQELAAKFDVPLSGHIPLDAAFGVAAEAGSLAEWTSGGSETAATVLKLSRALLDDLGGMAGAASRFEQDGETS